MPEPTPAAISPDTVTAFLVGACDVQIWGMSGIERAERMVRRAGIADVAIGGSEIDEGRTALIVRTDMVIDEALARALMARPGVLLAVERAEGLKPVAAHVARDAIDVGGAVVRGETVDRQAAEARGLTVLSPVELAGSYNSALRKKATPFVLELTEKTAREIERATFEASYKGVTDFVTKWIWPPVALPLTRYLARRGATPNAVTLASFACVLAAVALFATGHFLAGALFGWLMALLDTVDGKLARVTLTSSKWGNVFDHGIDLVAPPFWWLAWWYGLDGRGEPALVQAMWIMVGGYVAGKLLEQAFISSFGIKTHVWQPIDSAFRQVTARRNPNLAILTLGALAGAPAAGYLAAAGWMVICFCFHAVRLGQAFIQKRNGAAITSWLES